MAKASTGTKKTTAKKATTTKKVAAKKKTESPKTNVKKTKVASGFVLMLTMIILLGITLVCFYYFFNYRQSGNSNDAKTFKSEYEDLNQKKNSQGKEYLTVSIDKQNQIKYATHAEVMDVLNNGTGVIYFGFPECPWCRNMVGPLLDAATETGLEEILYYNALDIRDKKVLNNEGKIVVEEQGTDEYYELVNRLYSYLGEYEGLNDPTIKRLYFPTVVFVKDGSIVGVHIGTLDSQEDPYISLNDLQKERLTEIFSDYMNSVISCDDAC